MTHVPSAGSAELDFMRGNAGQLRERKTTAVCDCRDFAASAASWGPILKHFFAGRPAPHASPTGTISHSCLLALAHAFHHAFLASPVHISASGHGSGPLELFVLRRKVDVEF